jgi:uncharacterized membrane protein
MSLGKMLGAYASTGVVFFIIDLVWLVIMNPRFYKPQLAAFMAEKVNWLPAAIFYLLIPLGLLVLAIFPAVDKDSWLKALVFGGLLGLVAYGTYDLTNLASLKNWPLAVTLVDIAWGTFLSASTAVISFFIMKLIK